VEADQDTSPALAAVVAPGEIIVIHRRPSEWFVQCDGCEWRPLICPFASRSDAEQWIDGRGVRDWDRWPPFSDYFHRVMGKVLCAECVGKICGKEAFNRPVSEPVEQLRAGYGKPAEPLRVEDACP
jgi:hypothetical protein